VVARTLSYRFTTHVLRSNFKVPFSGCRAMFPNVADFPTTKMPVSASLTGLSAHLGYTSRYDSYF